MNKTKMALVGFFITLYILFINTSVYAQSEYYYLNHKKIKDVALNYIIKKYPEFTKQNLELRSISLVYDLQMKKTDNNITVNFCTKNTINHSEKTKGDKKIIKEKKKSICLTMNPDGEVIKDSIGTLSSFYSSYD